MDAYSDKEGQGVDGYRLMMMVGGHIFYTEGDMSASQILEVLLGIFTFECFRIHKIIDVMQFIFILES